MAAPPEVASSPGSPRPHAPIPECPQFDAPGPHRETGGAQALDNLGGIGVVDHGAAKCTKLCKLWVDAGFKQTFIDHCTDAHDLDVEVVNRIHPAGFHVLPRRWVVERTWAWLVNHRRLRIDYERDPAVTEGFVWAAHTRQLLRRLTAPAAP